MIHTDTIGLVWSSGFASDLRSKSVTIVRKMLNETDLLLIIVLATFTSENILLCLSIRGRGFLNCVSAFDALLLTGRVSREERRRGARPSSRPQSCLLHSEIGKRCLLLSGFRCPCRA